jgi:hypothetical protein
MGVKLVVASVLMVTLPFPQPPKPEESFVKVLQKDSLPCQQVQEWFPKH